MFFRDIPSHTLDYISSRKRIIEYPFLCFEWTRSSGNRASILDNNKRKTKKTVENYLSYFASAPGFEMKWIKKIHRPRVGW